MSREDTTDTTTGPQPMTNTPHTDPDPADLALVDVTDATCAYCDARITPHGDDPTGDYLVWQHHTGETRVYCTLFHMVKDFEAFTDAPLDLDSALDMEV